MTAKKNYISIIISNFNKENYIYKSLKSITSEQNFSNYEIIIFDDNSTDKSLKIIKKFKNVKLLKNKAGKKKSPILNQINGLFEAFKKSKGDIICLMDSDDIFKRNKLTSIKNFFKKNLNKKFVVDKPKTTFYLNLDRTEFKKNNWPSIFPTSCISLRRSFFKKFIKYSKKNSFPNLEIDARVTIFACHYYNDFNILKKKLTIYLKDKNGITSKYKKFNKLWWEKRYEAFCYLNYILNLNNKKFNKSIDYFVTKIIYTFYTKYINK